MAFCVYAMTNKERTVLYLGMTNDLSRRVGEHRQGEIPGFTKRYQTNRLVYFECFEDPRDAVKRERQLKGWRRSKKDALVNAMNPKWEDLAVSELGFDPL